MNKLPILAVTALLAASPSTRAAAETTRAAETAQAANDNRSISMRGVPEGNLRATLEVLKFGEPAGELSFLISIEDSGPFHFEFPLNPLKASTDEPAMIRFSGTLAGQTDSYRLDYTLNTGSPSLSLTSSAQFRIQPGERMAILKQGPLDYYLTVTPAPSR